MFMKSYYGTGRSKRWELWADPPYLLFDTPGWKGHFWRALGELVVVTLRKIKKNENNHAKNERVVKPLSLSPAPILKVIDPNSPAMDLSRWVECSYVLFFFSNRSECIYLATLLLPWSIILSFSTFRICHGILSPVSPQCTDSGFCIVEFFSFLLLRFYFLFTMFFCSVFCAFCCLFSLFFCSGFCYIICFLLVAFIDFFLLFF